MIYFDTSALIRAWTLGQAPRGMTRQHSLAEFYSTLTGVGIHRLVEGRIRATRSSPKEAAAAARATCKNMIWAGLTAAQAIAALDLAARANEVGVNIHDWMHCQAAERAGCEQIATLNFADFARMTRTPLITPEAALA